MIYVQYNKDIFKRDSSGHSVNLPRGLNGLYTVVEVLAERANQSYIEGLHVISISKILVTSHTTPDDSNFLFIFKALTQ